MKKSELRQIIREEIQRVRVIESVDFGNTAESVARAFSTGEVQRHLKPFLLKPQVLNVNKNGNIVTLESGSGNIKMEIDFNKKIINTLPKPNSKESTSYYEIISILQYLKFKINKKLTEGSISSKQVKEIKKLFKLGWSPEDIVDELFDGDDKYLKKVEKLDPQK